jgi:type IV fimbrial biogenesis protein FimT
MRLVPKVYPVPPGTGLTLLELMVSISVLALLAAAAVPSFDGFLQRREMLGVSQQLVADLQGLRSAALARQEKLRLTVRSPVAGRGGCYAVHTGAADACSCDTSVRCSSAELLRGVVVPADGRVLLRANVASMLFDPRQGTVSPFGTVELVARDGRTLRHIVNLLGRVRVCASVGSWPEVPAC